MAVLGFDPGAVVAIVADDGSSLGSGYALGNGRVLTAKHVVGSRACVVVGGSPMTPCWTSSSEQADIALLAPVDETPPIGPPRVVLHHGDALGREWMANGFPALVGASSPASGKVEPGQSPDGHCHISVVAFPTAAEAWKGMSGAAVFVNNQLWAVLHSASGWRYGMLKAVPLRPFLDTGLRAALGVPDQLEERHALAVKKISAELDSATLARLIVEHHAWASEGSDREAIAAAILATQPPSELAAKFRSIFHAMKKEHQAGHDRRDLAKSVMRVFEWAMPYASGWWHISTPLDESGCRTMRAHYALTVEPSVAWNAERSMQVELDPAPRPSGYLEVPPPTAILSGGIGVRDQAEVVLEHFAEQLDALAMRWFKKRKLSEYFEDHDLELKLLALNEEMRNHDQSTYFTVIEDIEKVGGRRLLIFLRDHISEMEVIVSALQKTDNSAKTDWKEEYALRGALDQIYQTHAAILGTKS